MKKSSFNRSMLCSGRHPRRVGSGNGFTLIELLVVVTIIGVLAAISVPVVGKALEAAASVKESAAAKTLITAYLAASSDNNGNFLPGYDRTTGAMQMSTGTTVSGPTVQRYPYRLAPYFDNDIKGTILTSNNKSRYQLTDYYQISAYPSFAINYLLVGGDISAAGVVNSPSECLQVPGRSGAGSLLVFATAADDDGTGGKIEGYCKMESPRGPTNPWSSATWNKSSSPRSYGQVDARYGGKAICAFTDGSVRKLTIEELRDMRLWSYRAAANDNPDYQIQ